MYKLSIFFMYDFSSLFTKTELVQTYKTVEYRKVYENWENIIYIFFSFLMFCPLFSANKQIVRLKKRLEV